VLETVKTEPATIRENLQNASQKKEPRPTKKRQVYKKGQNRLRLTGKPQPGGKEKNHTSKGKSTIKLGFRSWRKNNTPDSI